VQLPQTLDRAQRRLLKLAGGLLLGGFLIFTIATQFHPHGHENDHAVIFAKYAASDAWVAVHFAQFAGVLTALGGFAGLARLLQLRGDAPVLAKWALGATVATAAVWAVLQAVDGVALKQNVDAWVVASGAEKSTRFANAETTRWIEWGLQAYYRLLLGLTLALVGIAAARTRIIARWLGGVGVLAGLPFATIGIAVGESGFKKPGDPLFSLLVVTFAGGILAAGLRTQNRSKLVAA